MFGYITNLFTGRIKQELVERERQELLEKQKKLKRERKKQERLEKQRQLELEKYIEKYIDKPWYCDKYDSSMNPSITPEFVEKYRDKPWDWQSLEAAERRKEENYAARVIQRGCHNWLWKPVCRDGTLGINVRLGMKSCGVRY